MTKDESPKSKGGKARAAKLTPEERSAIARDAASARWALASIRQDGADLAESGPKVYVADHFGVIDLGPTQVECAVLEGQIRVLSERELAKAFGAKRGGAHWRRRTAEAVGSDLPVILSAGNLQPFIDDDLRAELESRFLYRVPRKRRHVAHGMKAELLPQICEVYLKARDKGKLIGRQHDIAIAADILVRSLAKIGIIALVDEATGFQKYRDREALQEFLSKLIGNELAKWERKFPIEFYKEIFRLKGWTFDAASTRRPFHMAQITADVIYKRLGPQVLEELRRRMPTTESGRRKGKLFQLLTLDIGHPALDKQVEKVVILATGHTKWDDFYRGLERVSPHPDKTPKFDFGD